MIAVYSWVDYLRLPHRCKGVKSFDAARNVRAD
jgi:hypothetical protein